MPFAIEARQKRGDSNWQLTKHILARTIALLAMGVFLVNGETYNAAATGMPKVLWNPICCFCFILIWNSYPKTANAYLVGAAKIFGIVVLLIMAYIYRGGPDDDINYFGPQWWGILGLIGWAYLVSGLITVFAKNNFFAMVGAWVFFGVLSMISHAGWVPQILHFIPDAILGGTLTGLTMGGALTTCIFKYYRTRNDDITLTRVLFAFSAILIALSLLTRPYWGLAKLGATPAWLFLCSAFTVLAFVVIYWVADVLGKANWFRWIRPAGTDTLLCYLIPYFAYASTRLLGIHLPEMMLTGGAGIIKSLIFALLCVFIAGGLSTMGVRLKL
jgi:hypothetical protein